jgi:hypothetical protein
VSGANSKIRAASLPEAPLAMSFRKSLLGSGSVASIKNTSNQSIAVTITAIRPAANERFIDQTGDYSTGGIGEYSSGGDSKR